MGSDWCNVENETKPKIVKVSPTAKCMQVAKGFEETPTFGKDSPTCSKPLIQLSLAISKTKERGGVVDVTVYVPGNSY